MVYILYEAYKIIKRLQSLSQEDLLNLPFGEFIFPPRQCNIFTAKLGPNFKYLWQICELNENELMQIEGCGKKSITIIKECLSEFGLSLNMDISNLKGQIERANAVIVL